MNPIIIIGVPISETKQNTLWLSEAMYADTTIGIL